MSFVTAFSIAQRFVGIEEIEGKVANPQILVMLNLDSSWPKDDSVPWCSAFVNYVCWLLGLGRSKNLRARSWLQAGTPVSIDDAVVGYDVVVFKRGGSGEPGPEVIEAKGHVGFFAGVDGESILVLGGNQNDSVNISKYPKELLLGVRRLA